MQFYFFGMYDMQLKQIKLNEGFVFRFIQYFHEISVLVGIFLLL